MTERDQDLTNWYEVEVQLSKLTVRQLVERFDIDTTKGFGYKRKDEIVAEAIVKLKRQEQDNDQQDREWLDNNIVQ